MDTIRCSGFVALFEARGEGKIFCENGERASCISWSPGSIPPRVVEPDCAKIARNRYERGEGSGPSLFRGEIFFSSILETLIRLFLNDIILRKCYSFKINIIKVSKIKEKIFIHYNEVFRENRYTIIMVYEFLISKILPVDNMYYILETVIFDKSHCSPKKFNFERSFRASTYYYYLMDYEKFVWLIFFFF